MFGDDKEPSYQVFSMSLLYHLLKCTATYLIIEYCAEYESSSFILCARSSTGRIFLCIVAMGPSLGCACS